MAKPTPNDRINLTKLTCLVIDDNALSLELISQIMTAFGIGKLIQHRSAEASMRVIMEQPVDLIITDGQMPGMDGYSFTRWVRGLEHAENRYAPILLLTGETRASYITRGRDVGASLVVSKPINPQALLDRLFWVSLDEREFVESDFYSGPDRRFKVVKLEDGVADRREGEVVAKPERLLNTGS